MSSSSVLWSAGQATGIVSLILFTGVMVLGTMVGRRVRIPGLPRFGTVALHRSVSLLAMAFLAVHILSAVADSYVRISLLAVVLPFASAYQPLWLGLGTVAFDLLLAVALTSLLRARIGRRAWRAVHWLAYASWPVAVVHGFTMGAGRNTTMTGWTLWLTVGCVLSVMTAVGLRLRHREVRPTPAELMRPAPRTAHHPEFASAVRKGA